MKKFKLYLETSVWNFVFADDAPELRDLTLQFFDMVKRQVYDVYISDLVIFEIGKASGKKKEQLMGVIEQYQPTVLESNPVAQDLADRYLEAKIVPAKKKEDALHVAIATLGEMDAVVSWNFEHLANLRKSEIFYAVSVMNGYHRRVEIITPMEVLYAEGS